MKTLHHLLTLALLLLSHGSLDAAQPGKTQNLTSPDQVPEGLAKSDWSSIRAAYEAGRHAFQPTEHGWQARNPGQQWTTQFDGRGFLAKPKEGDWTWGLELRSYGVGEKQTPVGERPPQVKAAGQRLTYDWDATLQEWWVNDQRGLEHGYIVRERPEQKAEVGSGNAEVEGAAPSLVPSSEFRVPTSPLSFTLATRGTLTPKVTADALGVEFRDASGATVLHYAGLKVWDADGKTLPSHFEAAGGKEVRLLVDERGARYPLTIDPIAQQAYLKAGNNGPAKSDQFGYSVAVSGDTVVVGAPFENSSTTGVNSTPDDAATDAGAAYVFVRSAGVWTQQAYLKPAAVGTTQVGDQFGFSVAVAGDTVVVGANAEDSSTTGVRPGAGTPNDAGSGSSNSGAAYVFVRSGTAWSQEAYAKASDTPTGSGGAGDRFGSSVAVAGDTVVVGAEREDSSTTGVNSTPDDAAPDAGAAYVFVRSAGVWTQQAYLKPAAVGTTQLNDRFGSSVAVAGDTVVVGARWEASSTTGVQAGAGTPNDDGTAIQAGAAYVFVRSAGVWTQQAYLKPAAVGTTQLDDQFGYSVAVSGDTVVVGAFGEDSSTTGVQAGAGTPNDTVGSAGAAYVFVRSAGVWTQQAYLKPAAVGTSQAYDFFGTSVAVAGDTVVVAARLEDSSSTGVNSTPDDALGVNGNTGAAYIFVRSAGVWTQQAYLKPAAVGTTQANDQFGISVAVAGDTVVVGAYFEDSSTLGVAAGAGTPNESASLAGAAYVFTVFGPTVTGITPLGGPTTGGTIVTITGPEFNLASTTMVTLGGVPATGVTVLNGTTITATTGAHATGLVDVVVTNFGGPGTGTNLFRYASNTLDTDGDGLNDAAELVASAQGFDWQVAQPALVNSFRSGLGLYTPAQVQALKVGTPLIQRHPTTGVFTLTIGVEKSTTLTPLSFTPFSMLTAPGAATSLNGAGKLEFRFTAPDNAAFFRLQSQ